MKWSFPYLVMSILFGGLFLPSYGQKTKQADKVKTDMLIEKNRSLIEIVIPASKSRGFGSTKGVPEGTDFKLPPCVKIVERPHHPFDPDIKKLYGSINTFYADISFVNECPGTVTVEFPAGLVLVSIQEGIQNGVLITREVITVPPTVRPGNRNKDTTTIYLGLACLNERKGLPWGENSEEDTKDYAIGKGLHKVGVVSNDKGLLQLLGLFSNKPKLKVKKHYNPQDGFNEERESNLPAEMEIYGEIQKAIWKLTDGQGITRGELDKLKSKLKNYE